MYSSFNPQHYFHTLSYLNHKRQVNITSSQSVLLVTWQHCKSRDVLYPLGKRPFNQPHNQRCSSYPTAKQPVQPRTCLPMASCLVGVVMICQQTPRQISWWRPTESSPNLRPEEGEARHTPLQIRPTRGNAELQLLPLAGCAGTFKLLYISESPCVEKPLTSDTMTVRQNHFCRMSL